MGRLLNHGWDVHQRQCLVLPSGMTLTDVEWALASVRQACRIGCGVMGE
ncbi:MAG: hypothetical protein LZF60_250116 [Nitrospira sp.]|nr:MAG: hypothetical protein LZF60_250116 [Nitrospira sp.]